MDLTHWEYVFLLVSLHLTKTSRESTNPFSGEAVRYRIEDPLSKEEIESAAKVLEQRGFAFIEGEGYYSERPDGEHISFRCPFTKSPSPVTGMAVEIVCRELSLADVATVLDVARAGNLGLASSVGDLVRVVDRDPTSDELVRWPDVRSIMSVDDAHKWIIESIGGRKVRSGWPGF